MHTVALASDCTVWTWGCNDEGALGRKGAENTPLQVSDTLTTAITDISAGDSHTIAYNTRENCVYYWGCYRVSNQTFIGSKHFKYNLWTPTNSIINLFKVNPQLATFHRLSTVHYCNFGTSHCPHFSYFMGFHFNQIYPQIITFLSFELYLPYSSNFNHFFL